MIGIGAVVRTIVMWIQSNRLDRKIDSLTLLDAVDTMSLVPASYRQCAKIRLLQAQSGKAGAVDTKIHSEFVSEFEATRKAAVERMMEQASKQTATKDEVIKLVHTLDEYARACQSDLAKQSSRTDTLQTNLARLESQVAHAVQRLNSGVSSLESSLGKLHGNLDTSSRSLRTWLIALSMFALVEGIALLYLFTRM